GALLFGIVLGITVSALVVGVLGLTLLIRRDWVPIVYNVRSLTVRKVTTAVTAGGLALVVFVFATVLMLSSGIKRTLAGTGSEENAKIIRKGSMTEMQSGMLPEHLRLLGSVPEVAMGKDGQPLASPELVVLIFALKTGATDDTQGTNLAVRGVGPKALELHPPKKLEGRLFAPGTSEIVIGKGLAGRFQGATLDGTVRFARRDWKVVGVMDAGGSAYDSEIWGDVDQMMDAFQRRPSYSSLTLRLKDRSALQALETRMAGDPQLSTLEVKSEVRYWAAQSEQFAGFITFLGVFVAIIFSFGAILGAMITMYAQVAARTKEIGTLRAMGFRRRAVLVSFVAESVLMAMAAGGIGVAAASLWQLTSFSTMNFQSFSEVTFRFHLSPGIVAASIAFAALMGYAGGFLPAMRAARMPIVRATRGG
ncbi:MAG TPA: ABC transporter permease, partial [Kofleriaceae bacterium]|nr:ABC transporter permease [Kofleriaceae bacterium]